MMTEHHDRDGIDMRVVLEQFADEVSDLRVVKALAEEREKNDQRYAIKLIERAVIGLVALVLSSLIAYWLAVVLR